MIISTRMMRGKWFNSAMGRYGRFLENEYALIQKLLDYLIITLGKHLKTDLAEISQIGRKLHQF